MKSDSAINNPAMLGNAHYWKICLPSHPMPLTLSENDQVSWLYKHAIMNDASEQLSKLYGFCSSNELKSKGYPLKQFLPRINPYNQAIVLMFVRNNYSNFNLISSELDTNSKTLIFNNTVSSHIDGENLLYLSGLSQQVSLKDPLISEFQHFNLTLASLTKREFCTLKYLLCGIRNKQIATHMQIAEKTVKIHRGNIMGKFTGYNLAQIIRMCVYMDIKPAKIT